MKEWVVHGYFWRYDQVDLVNWRSPVSFDPVRSLPTEALSSVYKPEVWKYVIED